MPGALYSTTRQSFSPVPHSAESMAKTSFSETRYLFLFQKHLTPTIIHIDNRRTRTDSRWSRTDNRMSHTDNRWSHTDNRWSHTDNRWSHTDNRRSHTDHRWSHTENQMKHFRRIPLLSLWV